MDTAFPSLALRYGVLPPEAPDGSLPAWLPTIRSTVFDNSGVIAPVAVLEADPELSAYNYRLELNGETLFAFYSAGTPKDVAENALWVLNQHLDKLLTPRLVEYYLHKVGVPFPALVEAVRARFDLESLTAELQSTVRGGASIRNFVESLESILESAPEEP